MPERGGRPSTTYRTIALLVVRAGVASHRADVTVLQCAKALAALAGHGEVEREELLAAAALALGHRVPVDPFDGGTGIDERVLRRILDDVLDQEAREKKAAGPATPGPTPS